MFVRAKQVSYKFPDGEPLFSSLDFEIRGGQIAAIVGPSGSGKSTLLSLLAGFTSPTRGAISREGVISTQWVFQNPHGPSNRTVLDISAMPALSSGANRDVAEMRAGDALDSVGLAPRAAARFRDLSGGEAQRLMLARALVAAPQLLLVDEPTAQLDKTAAATVTQVLRALGADGRIVVIATHDSRVVRACDLAIEVGGGT